MKQAHRTLGGNKCSWDCWGRQGLRKAQLSAYIQPSYDCIEGRYERIPPATNTATRTWGLSSPSKNNSQLDASDLIVVV